MAQADQVVQNDNFPTVRADINNNLAALFTNSSGGTAPTVTVAYQDWIDTSGADPIWKKRNAANNAWITVGTIKTGTIELAADNVLPSQSGQSGKYLSTDGTLASWNAIVTGLSGAEIFASSGSWTCPAGITKVVAVVVGGGGGGRTASQLGQPGGTGGIGIGFITVSPGTTYTVTVGSGGAGGSTAGSSGGTSTFSSISATGGAGGTTFGSTTQPPAASGSSSSADANIRRSNTSIYDPLFVGGRTFQVPTSAGFPAQAWSITSIYSAGSRGLAGGTNAAGGVGGAVALLY